MKHGYYRIPNKQIQSHDTSTTSENCEVLQFFIGPYQTDRSNGKWPKEQSGRVRQRVWKSQDVAIVPSCSPFEYCETRAKTGEGRQQRVQKETQIEPAYTFSLASRT